MMLWKLAHVSGRNLLTISKAQGLFLRNLLLLHTKLTIKHCCVSSPLHVCVDPMVANKV